MDCRASDVIFCEGRVQRCLMARTMNHPSRVGKGLRPVWLWAELAASLYGLKYSEEQWMEERERKRWWDTQRESHMGQGKGEHQREGENQFCGRDMELKNNRSWEMERERSGGKRAKAETSVRIIWKEVDRFCEMRLTEMPEERKCYCNCNHIY